MVEQSVSVLTKRGEDLRYVTEHFQDLQGAGLAPLWAFILVFFSFGFERGSGRAILTTAIAAVVVAVISHLWARNWYCNRYGVVINPASSRSTPPSKPSPTDAGRPILFLQVSHAASWNLQAVLAVLIFGPALAAVFFRPFDSETVLISGVVVATVPVLLPRCLDTAPNTATRLRKMLYSTSLAAIVALSAWSFFGGLDGRWLWASGAGCCLFVAVYDHWLLDHVLRPDARPLGNDDE